MLFRSRFHAAVPVFLLMCSLVSAQAANDGNRARQSPSDRTEPVKVTTRMVVVDVVAHDKKGATVLGLKQSDLRILEDGKEQEISSFNFSRPSSVPVKAPEPTFIPVDLPGNHFGNAPQFPSDAALNVLLMDSLNSNLLNQAYVRTEMIKFLTRLPEGQPVAIFTLGRKLKLLQDFTTDQTTLKKVVEAFRGGAEPLSTNPAGTSANTGAPKGMAEQVLAQFAPQMLAQINDFVEQTTADQSDMRIQYTFAALTSVANILSHYHGRKNLFWISEAIPMNIFADFNTVYRASPNGSPNSGQGSINGNKKDYGYAQQLAHLANLFADAQIAVYPVDARGLMGSPLYNVADNIGGSGGAAMGGLAMKAEGKQAEELFQAHVSMLDIADKTGGKAFYNRNDIDNSLSEGINDGSTYYSLGYYPVNKHWDGRFRKIEVKTKLAGVKLRYRTGYFALERTPFDDENPARRDAEFSQALNPDSPVNNSLQFRASVAPQASSNPIVLHYVIDPHAISFTSGPTGSQRAQVDCAARVFTRDNPDKPVKTEATKVNAVLESAVYERISKSFFPCQVKLDLPPGRYFVRLGVRDSNSGRIGTANADITVPAQATTTARKP